MHNTIPMDKFLMISEGTTLIEKIHPISQIRNKVVELINIKIKSLNKLNGLED